MEDLFAQIAIIENWLRDKPHVGQAEKSEMTSRLRELNERLNEFEKGLQLLNKGESPIKAKKSMTNDEIKHMHDELEYELRGQGDPNSGCGLAIVLLAIIAVLLILTAITSCQN